MIQYSNHAFAYDHHQAHGAEPATRGVRSELRRVLRTAARKRSRKRTAELTINGRRNRRWAW